MRFFLAAALFSSSKFNYAKGQFSAIAVAITSKWKKENILLHMEQK
jgi:hypothetical protein